MNRGQVTYMKALTYALERKSGLRVFLENPEVPVDNNHVERTIRPSAIGRKNCVLSANARNGVMIPIF